MIGSRCSFVAMFIIYDRVIVGTVYGECHYG